jgi:hypothetical protein
VPDETPDATGQDHLAPEARGGEDARRRGWFWHWNSIVTQYAPLIGLKGVGLLNSYTVWTDRREDSPHRGYAFPSQQSEANFYGEDRAELITINKILVALDLIEIRKEMVLHVDEKGRRWRVPHNLYRVKDQASGFNLTIDDVLRVTEVAARDRAVYRYIRRVFSTSFAPIDRVNVWHQILPAVRQTETWQRLAARAEREDARASARSKAGHESRSRRAKGKGESQGTRHRDSGGAQQEEVVSTQHDLGETSVAPVNTDPPTDVATSNNGSATSVDESNQGFDASGPTIAGGGNQGGQTVVGPGNTTYYQASSTTTTTTGGESQSNHDEAGTPLPQPPTASPGAGPLPAPSAVALDAFEAANDRPATRLERDLLTDLERDFADAARRAETTSAAWVADAIREAVNSGSRFVAPKRIREILVRWSTATSDQVRPGGPGSGSGLVEHHSLAAPSQPLDASTSTTGRRAARRQPVPIQTDTHSSTQHTAPRKGEGEPETAAPVGSVERPIPVPRFPVAPGLSSTQVWAAAREDLAARLTAANFETWIRPAELIGLESDGSLVVGVPSQFARQRVESRLQEAIRSALAAILGYPVEVRIVVTQEWLRRQGTSATSTNTGSEEGEPD